MSDTITKENVWNRDSPFAKFTRAYIECGLWCEELEGEHDLDSILPDDLETIFKDCEKFFMANNPMFNGAYEQAGHDFYLTRNGHGAGFWDRPEVYGGQNIADLLTDAAEDMQQAQFNYDEQDKTIYYS